MSVYVDTSALYAMLDGDDANHAQARVTWIELPARREELIYTNYVLVETFALVQRRLGMEAVRTLQEDLIPILRIEWVDETRHLAGVNALLSASRRQISLVDCVSFEAMRRLGLKMALAFDRHFGEQGFGLLPC